MSKKSLADSIRVADPCTESWEEMSGNDQIRFCSHCSKNVNNLSGMTPQKVARLVRRSNGRLCVRYRVDSQTGSPIFNERVARFARHGVAAGVLGASLLNVNAAYAQGSPDLQMLVQIERPENTGVAAARVSGYVTDPNGAAIAYALVSLTNQETLLSHVQNASAEGFYEFKDIEAGKYKLRFEAGGFASYEIDDVYLSDASELRRDSRLSLITLSEVVEVPAIDKSEFVGIIVGAIEVISDGRRSNDLVSAVLNGDLENVKARTMMGAKINARDKTRDGMSPLHAAVETGNLEIAEYLLNHGAKPNIRDHAKQTPMMMMDFDGTPEMLELLVRFGAKPHLVDKEKNTILHHLAENAEDDVLVRGVVALGVNANAVNREGKTPLMIAVENGHSSIVKALLESGADVNARDRSGRTALDLASAEANETRSILELYGGVRLADR